MISGLAVAERLGADYPFPHDELACAQVCALPPPPAAHARPCVCAACAAGCPHGC